MGRKLVRLDEVKMKRIIDVVPPFKLIILLECFNTVITEIAYGILRLTLFTYMLREYFDAKVFWKPVIFLHRIWLQISLQKLDRVIHKCSVKS